MQSSEEHLREALSTKPTTYSDCYPFSVVGELRRVATELGYVFSYESHDDGEFVDIRCELAAS